MFFRIQMLMNLCMSNSSGKIDTRNTRLNWCNTVYLYTLQTYTYYAFWAYMFICTVCTCVLQKMTQQIYDDHLKSTHDTLKEWGPHKAIGFCWDRWSLQLDCTQCSFFNNYKNMNHTLTCQSKPSKCLHSHRHKRPFHKRWRVWISDQRMQCLGISEWKISVNEKQTQIHWREIKELESWL